MTLTALINLAEADLGMRYQLTREQIVSFIDYIQKIALGEDLENFLYWEATLTVLQELTFGSAGYTSCVDSDIGLTVVQGAKTGTLRYFNNTTRKWAVETTDTFVASTATTITSGTGAGTTAATSFQAVYRGPYSYPNVTGRSALIPPETTTTNSAWPRARKLLGITKLTDKQLFTPSDIRSLNPALVFDENATTDYNLRIAGFDERRMFEQIRDNFLDRTITFVRDPDADANTDGTPYRWVYWRQAPNIDTEYEDTDLLIPEQYHHTLVYQGVEALAARHLYGEPTSSIEALQPFLKPFWTNTQEQFTRNGEASTRVSRGQP